MNVGPLDRIVRILVGVLIIAYRYIGQFRGAIWDLLVFLGALWIWEGVLGYCFLYGVLGWSSRNRPRLRRRS